MVGWFPNLTRAYDNNGRCPRQKFVFGILQLLQQIEAGEVFIYTADVNRNFQTEKMRSLSHNFCARRG